MNEIKQLLLKELAKSRAPITNRLTACVLETEDGNLYSSHNIEVKNGHIGYFIHAEPQAIKSIKKNNDKSKIKVVYLVGRNQEKIKHIAPCNKCFHRLHALLSPNAKIVLYQSENFDRKITFSLEEILPAYSCLEYSEIISEKIDDIKKELKKKTLLKGKDLIFVSNLRLFGIKEKIHFYITGSLSGRGSISCMINKKIKRVGSDMDIIAVSKSSKTETDKRIACFIKRFYKITNVVRWRHWYYSLKAYRTPIYYFDKSGRKVVDLSIAKDLKSGMYMLDFYKNNWYHKIS